MTQPNLVEILSELPEERRYHTVLALFSPKFKHRIIERNLGLDLNGFSELLNSVPTDLLSETLDYFEGTDSVHYAHEMIAQIEGVRRNGVDLIRRGAEFLEQHGDSRKAGYLYEQLGGLENIRKAAECCEDHARAFTPEYIEMWGDDRDKHEVKKTWEHAGELWESLEEWKRGSVCYENAALFEERGGSNLSRAVYLAEEYDVDRAIDLALRTKEITDEEGNVQIITIVDEDRATLVAARAGRYEQAISLAPDDRFGLKMQVAEMCGRYEDAVAFVKQIDHENFQEALKYYENNSDDQELSLDCRTFYLLKKVASFAKKAGMKETEDRFYGNLIRTTLENRDFDEAEDLAFEAERWEDFARVRLERRFDDGFTDVYNAVLDGSHVEKTELLEQALEDSQREGCFRTTAMIANFLGKQEQAAKYQYLGMITSK